MPLLVTDAIVLHAFDYLESSRIIRLLTRDAGVQSALARGARKSRGRYGTALDLFAEGSAQLYVKPNRELHNLSGFEITRTRGELAEDVGRFTAASTTPELASCALCHAPVRDAGDAMFSHSSGGVVCASCAKLAPGGRRLPSTARAAIRSWLEGGESVHLSDAEARSHQRLLREFLSAHMADDRPLRAFAVWEHERWSAA